MNLIEGLHQQMNRARELRKLYALKIAQAERSIESGDSVAMLDAYNELEALE